MRASHKIDPKLLQNNVREQLPNKKDTLLSGNAKSPGFTAVHVSGGATHSEPGFWC